MKTMIIIAGICFLIVMAGNKAVSENNTLTNLEMSTDTVPASVKKPKSGVKHPSADTATRKGLELIGSSDCTTCHRIKENAIGPSYKAIAGRYKATKANIELLAQRTIQGGSGVWGPVPMTPHPDLSPADARTMVKYILSLK